MPYKIDFDKIPTALSSEPLRCFICQAMRTFVKGSRPTLAAYIDSVAQCCTYLTVMLTCDVDLNSKDSIEGFMLDEYPAYRTIDIGVPTTGQARYILDVTEKIVHAAAECLRDRMRKGEKP